MRFVWDPRKESSNSRKHHVTFREASTTFGDPLSVTVPDPDHSGPEERFLLLGRTDREKLLVVAYAEHGDEIRIISARRATRRERQVYEEGE